MISPEEANKFKNEILKENKILYCMHGKSMMETCMCWGLEVPNAWLNEIDNLSQRLEAMNYIFYPRYKVRIQADQVKDKFAQLHFYYSIVIDPPFWICQYENLMDKMIRLLHKLDFGLKQVIDKEEYDETIEEPLKDNISFEDATERYKHVSNVEIIKKDNILLKKTMLHHYRQVHYEPTKHKFLHWILKNKYSIVSFIRRMVRFTPSYKQKCISELMNEYASNAIAKTENELTNVCENCGRPIGFEYSPRCVTRGWISYLCEDCANKDNAIYEKNGELWQNGVIIKDKNGKLLIKDNEN